MSGTVADVHPYGTKKRTKRQHLPDGIDDAVSAACALDPAPAPEPDGRVLVAGDIHGDLDWITTLFRLGQRHGTNRMVSAGDFGIWAHTPSGRTWLAEITRRAARHDMWVDVVGGNHENWTFLDTLAAHPDAVFDGDLLWLSERVRFAPNGARWTIAGTPFASFGGARSTDTDIPGDPRIPELDWWPGAEMPDEADLARLGTDPVDVLVTHDVPAAVSDDPGARAPDLPVHIDADCRHARRLIGQAVTATQPRLVVHGHWHERVSRVFDDGVHRCPVEGLAANVTRGRVGAWALLDLDTLELATDQDLQRARSRR